MARFNRPGAFAAAFAACLVLLLAQAAAAAAEAKETRAMGFTDSLRGRQAGAAAKIAAAKTASSTTAGGQTAEITSSLRAVMWKDCGSPGPVLERVYPFFFTTDLTCDDGHDSYYQRHDGLNGVFAPSVAAAATCTFEVDVRAYKIVEIDIGEIGGFGSPPVHIGKVNFNCYMNKEADECDAPVCSSLVLSGQGDWWYTWAQSKAGNYSTPLDTSNNLCIDITTTAGVKRQQRSGRAAHVATAASMARHYEDEGYGYVREQWGQAYIFTGLFESVGAHGGVQENGLFEYTHKFVAQTGPAPHHLPHVAPGEMQLRFFKEEGPAYGEDGEHH